MRGINLTRKLYQGETGIHISPRIDYINLASFGQYIDEDDIAYVLNYITWLEQKLEEK